MDELSKEQLGSLLAVLIAQLQRSGVLDSNDFDNMRRRLIDGGDEAVVGALNAALFSDLVDDPDRRRSTIHIIEK